MTANGNVEEPQSLALLTIVTATLNSESTLYDVAQSLRAQSVREFEWIVADGGSTDRTIEIARKSTDVLSLVLEGPDFGIYHGLNRAISAVRTPYYLVLGSDDTLEPDAVFHILAAIKRSGADFITGLVRTSSGDILRPARGGAFRYGHLAYISQHSVGTAIRTELHERVGLYSNQYPIAADRAFLLKAIEVFGASVSVDRNFWGVYATTGQSNTRYIDTLIDICKVDIAIRRRPFISLLRLMFSAALNFRRVLSA